MSLPIVKEIVSFMAPDVAIKKLADRLESGDVPPICEMVAELRDIARRMQFLESVLERHVVVPLTTQELQKAKEASMPGPDTPNLNRMIAAADCGHPDGFVGVFAEYGGRCPNCGKTGD